MVIVIDALDEVGAFESKIRNDILDALVNCIDKLPVWVKVAVTSRPEQDILNKFKKFTPFKIEADDHRHIEDLKLFISTQLKNKMKNVSEIEDAVEMLLTRSQGRFIYVSMVFKQLEEDCKSDMTMTDIENLPHGLDAAYAKNWLRILNHLIQPQSH
jgi:hypothetical protein